MHDGVISKKEAVSLGLKTYFTGKPCPKGHVAPRLVSNRNCSECLRASNNAYLKTPNGQKAQRAARNRYWKKNPYKPVRPKWADTPELRAFYSEKPEDKTVDHIIPIRGKDVCGLDVLYNLQYLDPEANRVKNNSVNHGTRELIFCPLSENYFDRRY